MSDKAVIKQLKQQVENLKRMNEILRKLVVSLSRSSSRSEKEEKEDKPRLH